MATILPIRNLTKTVHRTKYLAVDPANPAISAAGKTVLITGGATGIGYAIARSFAAAGAGTLILLARRAHVLEESAEKLRKEFEEKGTTVWTYAVDLKDKKSVGTAFEDVRAKLNSGGGEEEQNDIDILVTSAVHLEHGLPVLAYTDEAFRAAFETNVLGNMNVLRAFLGPEAAAVPVLGLDRPKELESKTQERQEEQGASKTSRGRTKEKIIIDVSTNATYVPYPSTALYAPTKYYFTYVLRHLQNELDQLGGSLRVRVHSFHPGEIYTPAAERAGISRDAYEFDDESLPGGFAVWLASPAAEFLKGRFLFARWDVDEIVAMRQSFEQDEELCRIVLKV
ncbi:hypothetical protein DBV05_g7952 [Lasiodiplodia theobromae]|uniref:Ketoreductase domain-containing protein n=1 Tax=Lasiodiplodia theobromae TaxID=45133 RepID=A0A5N5D6K0_9PEZI|nr:hypothetical protein DBV05_g7952 [Lasiodiplodia theobromae]